MLYKVYPPTIRVEYKDGAVAEHRLVWQNVRSGFLVSSLGESLGSAVDACAPSWVSMA